MPYHFILKLILLFTSVEAEFYLIDKAGTKTKKYGLLIAENIGNKQVLFSYSILIHYLFDSHKFMIVRLNIAACLIKQLIVIVYSVF